MSSEHEIVHAEADAHGEGAPHERPEDWGWHHQFTKGARVAGWLTSIMILVMIIGNHKGHVEDIWLILIAGVMMLMLARDHVRRKKSWRS